MECQAVYIGAKISGRQEGSRLLGKRQLGGHSQNTLTFVCIYQDMITFLLLKMSRDGKFRFGPTHQKQI
jgi:hypothetical protein